MINASIHKLENISFLDKEWSSLPKIAKDAIQLLITSQTTIVQWLEKKQLSEKIKVCFKNNESNRLKVDEIYNKLENDLNQNQVDFKLEQQQLLNQIIEQSLTIPDLNNNQQKKKNFEYNMQVFHKYYQEPIEADQHKEYLQYIEAKNIWQITNEFTQDCHLQDQLNILHIQVKDLQQKMSEKEQNLKDQIHNNRLKFNSFDQKLEQQQKSIQSIHDFDLKHIKINLDQLFKDFEKMLKCQGMLEIELKKSQTQYKNNLKQITDQIQQQNTVRDQQRDTLLASINLIKQEFQDRIDKLIQDNKILFEMCEQFKIQIKTQQEAFQGYSSNIFNYHDLTEPKPEKKEQLTQLQELKYKEELKSQLLIDLKQIQSDFAKFQKQISENYIRQQKLQVQVEDHHSDIQAIVTFKKKNFVNNIQAKMESFLKKQSVKYDQHELEIRQILDILEGLQGNNTFIQNSSKKIKQFSRELKENINKTDIQIKERDSESPPEVIEQSRQLERASDLTISVKPKLDYRFLRKQQQSTQHTPRKQSAYKHRSLQKAKSKEINSKELTFSKIIQTQKDNFYHHKSLNIKSRLINDKKPGSQFYADTQKTHLKNRSISESADLSNVSKSFQKQIYTQIKIQNDSFELNAEPSFDKTMKEENYQKQLMEIRSIIKEEDVKDNTFKQKYFSIPQ